MIRKIGVLERRSRMNELLFLGSGAADWDLRRREAFFRRKSAALLNGHLLLDCGPHIWDFARCEDPQVLDGVTDVLITHDHDDHFCPESLLRLAESRHLRVACDGWAREALGEHAHIEYIPVTPYEPFSLGKYKILPVLANHDVILQDNRQACHYIIRTPDRKKLFYGMDGAWFLRPTWDELRQHQFSVMVLDCTVGDRSDLRIFEHNSIPTLRMMVQQLRECKIVEKDGVIVASHFSRSLHGTREQTEAALRTADVRAAYDGMTLRF